MSRDGFARADLDVRWAYHRKARLLQRQHPRRWPVFIAAYFGLVGEAWASRSRTVTLEEAWIVALPGSIDEAQTALIRAGFLGEDGRIPEDSWSDWFGPAEARLSQREEAGRKGALARWHGDAMPKQSDRIAPTNQPTIRVGVGCKSTTGRRKTPPLAREDGGVGDFKDKMTAAGLSPTIPSKRRGDKS